MQFSNFILDIPSMWIIYPWYHPQRPRFFNMATMFVQVLVRIHAEIQHYVAAVRKQQIYHNFHDFYLIFNLQTFNLTSSTIITGLEDSIQIAYDHYTNWLETHKDLQIGANFLTNPQLFWMARAVFHFTKYHRTVAEETNPIQRLQIEFMHVEFKSKIGFQDAFKCAMNDEEWKTFDEYKIKYFEVLRKFKVL